MKADRLLSILLLLQAHGRMTGRELAERLEVSGRTIHRDMDALSAAGVPVYALRGSSGGWRLDEDWQTSVPGLDEAELRALLMAQPRVIGDVRLAAAAERAIRGRPDVHGEDAGALGRIESRVRGLECGGSGHGEGSVRNVTYSRRRAA